MYKISRPSYQKLKKDPTLYDDEERQTVRQIQHQERPRRSRFRVRRRWRFRVPKLRRFFKRVRRGNLVGAWSKVVRRLKESQNHFGDLFAGNYLFLQITPDSLKFKSKAPPPPLPLPYLSYARA